MTTDLHEGRAFGRVLYWAHVGGSTERRTSVRSCDAAFELFPLATPRHPYENVMLVDLATHPQVLTARDVESMLPPGLYLTEAAKNSLTAIDSAHLERRTTTGGDTVWQVTDTVQAFEAYWRIDDLYDLGPDAMEAAHAEFSRLAQARIDAPINLFPIPKGTVLTLTEAHMTTLRDLASMNVPDIRAISSLSIAALAQLHRIVVGVLKARSTEGAKE